MLARLLDCLAANARAESAAREVSVVLDEVQTLADGPTVERFLSQSRKFGAAVSMANQNPTALGARNLASVVTNAANLVLFRLPAREASLFADRLGEVSEGIPRLPNFHAVALAPSAPSPFIFRGNPQPEPDTWLRRELTESSRGRFGPGQLRPARSAHRAATKRSLPPRSRGRTRKSLPKKETAPARARSKRAERRLLEALAEARSSGARVPPGPRQRKLIRYWPEQHVWARKSRGVVVVGLAHGPAMSLGESPEVLFGSVGLPLEKGEVIARMAALEEHPLHSHAGFGHPARKQRGARAPARSAQRRSLQRGLAR